MKGLSGFSTDNLKYLMKMCEDVGAQNLHTSRMRVESYDIIHQELEARGALPADQETVKEE